MRSTIMILLSMFLSDSIALGGEIADGVYSRSKESSALKVVTQDGREMHLGEKCGLEIHRAEVRSQDNRNTRFCLLLTVPYDPQLERKILVVDGVAYRQCGGGSSQKKTSSLQFNISGGDNAERVAKHFRIQPVLRRHPQHCLEVSFIPAGGLVRLGEEVWVTLQITNVGKRTVAFMKGGMNRAKRDNQYVFSATFRGKQVRDVGTSFHFGGIAVRRILRPGDVFRDKVNLGKWFSFGESGRYEVVGSYHMDFVDPEGSEIWRTIWQTYVTAKFFVRVGSGKRPSNQRVQSDAAEEPRR